ncbi:aldo/keto reductase [Mesorhizobium sp. M4B.F.Ca.ET.215.01.1.1]|uniref:aldo/keto reductase n=1 Tax=unclassified Mesorhizobium TaxID=325217 RepID=UPI000FCC66BE|nr:MULTISPECIES: aldo/keto reductase [unclassified Mesorhizobium]RUW28302.1 aldo/keto reductase [Mesorhizobium sp. M4B.F.Ca.ET.013.02.1.1]RVD38886.1 aldo/keto reductase [Mesorhizobium sp. M4B.F.Ca.ET.019.03.1.1]TGQ10701.1 aldo/keto reductase [Mesorhizobium sp. M4B.F.Ca.ET.215.01.1.1]TGQ36271.1 aldo/keto reductase [Mesorhizobium sp. M4B.F.Ca.ET.214.01.1.1]TGQ38205.1 aldo/keto reductase [Mesorhizobium sp. M00.F.Ca.ET.220.01.1.1]
MSPEMLTRTIGASGISASAIGLGTWAIGGWMWGGTDEAQSIDTIRASIDEGVSLIDTAPAYGQGLSEEIVGKAIKGRRGEVVLATKLGLIWHAKKGNHFFDYDGAPVHRYLGADSVVYEVEQSLRRLGTDHIDHYITHWQDSTTPVAETMEALDRLKTQGKIRSIGASNVGVADVEAYLAAGQLDAVQQQYSMVVRDMERDLLPFCADNNVSVLSYSSLALGLLSGRIGPDRVFTGDDQRKDNPWFSQANRRKVATLMEEIRPIAEAHGASEAQIVIAWTLQQPGITFSLCGARSPQQARENAQAGRIRLSGQEISQISEAASRHLTSLDA